MRFLGMCAIMRDETPFLDEWIAFYIALGVEVFYLYDNESAIPVRRTVAKFADFSENVAINVTYCPGKAMQMRAYNHCLKTAGSECEWLAVVDLDEFILPKRHETIPELLENYEQYSGLAITRMEFGSSGHSNRPTGLQLENYLLTFRPIEMPLIKSIVKPRRVWGFPDPHLCRFKPAAPLIVNEDHTPVTSPFAPCKTRLAQVNHYGYRSLHDYLTIKCARLRSDIGEQAYFPTSSLPSGDTEDNSGLRFALRVRDVLARVGVDPGPPEYPPPPPGGVMRE